MKTKKGNFTSAVVYLIIGIFVLVLVVLFVIYVNGPGRLNDLIPGFGRTYNPVKWFGEELLENPDLIAYHIDGEEADIYIRYLKVDGNLLLQWRNDEAVKKVREQDRSILIFDNFDGFTDSPALWINVQDRNSIYYNALGERNKIFVDILASNSNFPEKVLEIVVNRVRENNEGKFLDVELDVYFNNEDDPRKQYNAGNRELGDLDGLVIKFNQITRGIIKVQ